MFFFLKQGAESPQSVETTWSCEVSQYGDTQAGPRRVKNKEPREGRRRGAASRGVLPVSGWGPERSGPGSPRAPRTGWAGRGGWVVFPVGPSQTRHRVRMNCRGSTCREAMSRPSRRARAGMPGRMGWGWAPLCRWASRLPSLIGWQM